MRIIRKAIGFDYRMTPVWWALMSDGHWHWFAIDNEPY